MILTAKDFEYDFNKRNECIQECREAVEKGKMDPQTMEELCDIERFAPFPWEVGGNCFLCGEKLTLPALAWSGCDKDDGNKLSHIAVHPDCAPRLFLGMRDDWHEYDITLRPGGETYDASKPFPFNGIHK
jgi:hypothetical protein